MVREVDDHDDDQIRIIDDAQEQKQEEVIRLGDGEETQSDAKSTVVEKMKPSGDASLAAAKTVGAPVGDFAKTEDMESLPVSDEEDEENVRYDDSETKWDTETEVVGTSSVPMGLFVVIGLVFLGVLAWVLMGNEDQEVEDDKVVNNERVERLERAEAERKHNEMNDMIRSFLKAETIEQMLPYVRHPERVEPLMRDYYGRHQMESKNFIRVKNYKIIPLESKPFLAMTAICEGDSTRLLIEDSDPVPLVDWETYVCYQNVSIEDYVKNRPTDSVLLRVYAQQDSFYSFEFKDVSEYEAYQLDFLESDEYLYGYVKRGTKEYSKFVDLFPHEGTAEMRKSYLNPNKRPLVLRVRFLENSKASRSVFIEDVISSIWAFPNDPSKVASADESD